MSRSPKQHRRQQTVHVQQLSPTELCEATPILTRARSVSPSQTSGILQQLHVGNSEDAVGIGLPFFQAQPMPDVSPLATPHAFTHNSHYSRTASLASSTEDSVAAASACYLHNRGARPSVHCVPTNQRDFQLGMVSPPSASFPHVPLVGNESHASFLASIVTDPTSRRSSCSSSSSLAVQRRAHNDASPVSLGNPSVIRHLTKRRERRMPKAAKSGRSSRSSSIASCTKEITPRSPIEDQIRVSQLPLYKSFFSSATASPIFSAARRKSSRGREAQPGTGVAVDVLPNDDSFSYILHREEEETAVRTKSGVKMVRRTTQEVRLPISADSYRRSDSARDRGDASRSNSRRPSGPAPFDETPSAVPSLFSEPSINDMFSGILLLGDERRGKADQ